LIFFIGHAGKHGACPPVSINIANAAWTRVSKITPPPPEEIGLLIFFARGLIQTFITRSDELQLLFERPVFWSSLRSRYPI
jgi:hypothetical protein